MEFLFQQLGHCQRLRELIVSCACRERLYDDSEALAGGLLLLMMVLMMRAAAGMFCLTMCDSECRCSLLTADPEASSDLLAGQHEAGTIVVTLARVVSGWCCLSGGTQFQVGSTGSSCDEMTGERCIELSSWPFSKLPQPLVGTGHQSTNPKQQRHSTQ